MAALKSEAAVDGNRKEVADRVASLQARLGSRKLEKCAARAFFPLVRIRVQVVRFLLWPYFSFSFVLSFPLCLPPFVRVDSVVVIVVVVVVVVVVVGGGGGGGGDAYGSLGDESDANGSLANGYHRLYCGDGDFVCFFSHVMASPILGVVV